METFGIHEGVAIVIDTDAVRAAGVQAGTARDQVQDVRPGVALSHLSVAMPASATADAAQQSVAAVVKRLITMREAIDQLRIGLKASAQNYDSVDAAAVQGMS